MILSKQPPKKSNKGSRLKDIAQIRFQLEKDADVLFRNHIEEIPESPDLLEKFDENTNKRSRKKTKKKETKTTIDLHGLTLEEAKTAVRRKINSLLEMEKGPIKLRVITGKGKHSGINGGVLISSIYDFVRKEYLQEIKKLDEDPSAIKLNGLPIRGYFDVWLNGGGTC